MSITVIYQAKLHQPNKKEGEIHNNAFIVIQWRQWNKKILFVQIMSRRIFSSFFTFKRDLKCFMELLLSLIWLNEFIFAYALNF